MRLAIPTPPVRRFAALLVAHDRSGAIVMRLVHCSAPVLKASEMGQVYSDAQGSYRWITVHPRGKDEEGVPVKIRESKTERGTWHVVGGAGGRLNYLRLTGVKSPEEYRRQAAEHRKVQASQKQRTLDEERERQKKLTDEERAAEAEQERKRVEQLGQRKTEVETKKQELVAAVARTLGWAEDEWKFDAMRARLQKAGASATRVEKLEAAHAKRVYAAALDAIAASKRQLLTDRERAVGALGGLPVQTADPDKVGLTDILEPPKAPKGKGYQSETTAQSDQALRAEAAARSIDEAKAALKSAQEGLGDDPTPEALAHISDLRNQVRMAELVREAETLTPAQIGAKREALAAESARVDREIQALTPQLQALRERARAGEISPDDPKLQSLEQEAYAQQKRQGVLRERAVDLAVMAEESTALALAGETATIRAKHRAKREEQIRDEHGEEGVARYRRMMAMLDEGRARYQMEMQYLKKSGALKAPDLPKQPVTDPEQVLQLIARAKGIRAMERQLARAGEGDVPDERMFGKGYFTEMGTPDAKAIAEAEADLKNAAIEQVTKAFLETADSPELLLGKGAEFTEDYDQPALHRALERHLSAGAYNALNTAGLAALKESPLKREVVDVLGAAGAAQLLGWAIHQHDPAAVAEMAKGLGDYHVAENVGAAEERLREVQDALDASDEALASITNPTDLAVAQEANTRRQAKLEEARQTIGMALGEYEATAALVNALGSRPATEISTNLGPIGTETAVRQLRALGLSREDYEITSDGTNYFATLRASAFPKLVTRPDPEIAKLTDDVMAIKRGERDEPGWRPQGTVVRTATSLNAPGIEPAPLHLPAFESFGSAGDVKTDLREYVARRAINGDDANDILADLTGNVMRVPEAHREGYADAVSALFPTEAPLVEHGKPVLRAEKKWVGEGEDKRQVETGRTVPVMRRMKAGDHAPAIQQLAEEYMREQGMDKASALHGQGIDVQDKRTHEAIFRALAKDPRAMVAFSPVGELTDQDQRALRHYWAGHVAKQATATGLDPEALDKLDELGPEPDKTVPSLFGGAETNSAWVDWTKRRDALMESAQFSPDGTPKTSSWDEYVTAMGGTARAYTALQDCLKSDFLREFHRHYTSGTNTPLRVGVRDIDHAELHQGYLDPKVRAKRLAEHRKLLDAARQRIRGKYATGAAGAKMERLAQALEIERQNQMSLLGATTESAGRREPGAGERFTLGQRVEAQIASLMPNVAQSFKPDQPTKLLPDVTYDGHPQRVIKQFLRTKRMANAMGAGSGKTSMMIGALGEVRARPETGVKRGLFLVPSSVQGQFGGEFIRFADPTKLQWAANPGGDRTQRLAEHTNAGLGAVVHTHQGFRDDMLHLVGQHLGVDDAGAKDQFMKLSRKDAAALMREVWTKAGIDYGMIAVDEGHGLLDRQGKPDSFLSRVVQAASDNAPYYMTSSADPVKNDVSELRSLLSKLDPDGKYDDAGAWQRRYGVATSAAAEALKREVAPWVYAAHIPSGNTVRRRTETVPMHPEQAKQYAAVMEAFEQLRAARGAGDVSRAVGPAKVLAPDLFKPGGDDEAATRRVMGNAGAFKEQALARTVDGAPRAINGKVQHLVTLLKDHPVRDKPVVIFAHRLDSVREITEALAEAGHRVESLTGADSAKERDRKRLRFQPESGDPEVDVFVLSDAGEAGLNLQRGQTLIQYDRPMTAKTHAQRSARIDRRGQQHPEIDLVDLSTDSPYEARAAERIAKKYELRDTLTDPATGLDETGLGKVFADARRRAASAEGARRAA